MSESAQTRWLHIHGVHKIPGYLANFRQPVTAIDIGLSPASPADQRMADLETVLIRIMPDYAAIPQPEWVPAPPMLQSLVRLYVALCAEKEIPHFDIVRGFDINHRNGPAVRVMLPSLGQDAAMVHRVVQGLIALQHAALDGGADDHLSSMLDALGKILEGHRPVGLNSGRFLRAAHEAGIPWYRETNNVYRFGWGSKSRWLDSSFTDTTSVIAAGIARDKVATAKLLRTAGMPIPAHQLANNADHAVRLANQLGYPIVIKPADQDGGIGVTAGIDHENAVRQAYDKASKVSKYILVEKHFTGEDYRLQVYHDTVYWAIRRMPAGVTGDGASTIQSLVEQTNALPMRGPAGSNSLLKHILIDEEAQDWLSRQNCTVDTILETDRFVRLKGAANIASGGKLVPVLEDVHPDNLALAVRAARLLRLDIAGIDLLISDIGRSWREVGAAICEVNAQPQLSPHLPALLLEKLIEGQGRIPVIAIVGEGPDTPWCAELRTLLATGGRHVGYATPGGAWLDDQRLTSGAHNIYQSGVALLADPLVDAMILHFTNADVYATGLPVDRIDALVVAGAIKDENGKADWNKAHGLARFLGSISASKWCVDNSEEWMAKADSLSIPVKQRCQPSALAKAMISKKTGLK